MVLFVSAVIFGLVLLVFSADRFVEASAVAARRLRVPPLLIGMVIVGFGTSAPEMLVSALSAWEGNSGIALGNVIGSNITNIALILGTTALINPISVQSTVLRKELPILTLATALSAFQLADNQVTQQEALTLLLVFGCLMAWTLWQGMRQQSDPMGHTIEKEVQPDQMPVPQTIFWIITGLVLMVGASKLLVWGASGIASKFGVSDLIIGLTVVAAGTSLPEFASSLMAARKNEHDLALGNILGSNLFNTLAVAGIAGTIHPLSAGPSILTRDIPVMGGLTLALFAVGYGFRGRPGKINRMEGAMLLAAYIGYTLWLAASALRMQ